MKTTFTYPGDPPLEAELLFGGDFQERNPHREIVIYGGKEVVRIPVEGTVCDVCNDEVRALDPCLLTPFQLYCWPCAQEWVLPYCGDEKEIEHHED